MKRLPPFAYFEPSSVAEAAEILAGEEGSRPLAGGTDLLVDMKTGRAHPAALVNLKRIEGLSGVDRVDGHTRIGALASVDAVARSPLVRTTCPALAGAAGALASLPVRRLATIGGNLGRASPASDLSPALMVLGARIEITGPDGRRDIPVGELFRGPGLTSLHAGEVVTAVVVPHGPLRSGSVYLKLGKRGGGTDIAVAGVAVSIGLGDDGCIAHASVALASLGPTPLQCEAAEEALRGTTPGGAVFDEAAAAAAHAAEPISDVRAGAAYRRTLASVLTRRALGEALAMARGEEEP